MPDNDSAHPLPDAVPALNAGGRVSILLVDDESRNLDVLESVLESSEYNLVRATSAQSALLKLLDGDFAAIVLDIQMPEMSGLELAGVIKKRRRTQHIPIIFLTAYYQEEKDVLQGYGHGAVDYLTKPIRPQILRSKVAVFVDLHRKNRALAATNTHLEQEIRQRQKAEEALRVANSELESRVKSRTSDLLDANEELRRRESAIRASRAQLQLVTDHAPVLLIQCDREHRFTFANRTFAEQFGLEPGQLIGKSFSDVLGSAAYEAFRHHFDATLDGRRVEFETEINQANSGPRWLHVVQEPERTPRGEVIGLVAVITDITERKLVEREILLARDKAVAASRAKDDFLARLSHELRTPLNPVLLLASDSANDAKLPENVRADFEMIAQNVTLEARLIDDLLDLSLITHGKLVLELRPFDVHSILLEALSMVNPEAAQKHVSVSIDLRADRHSVMCDDVRLKQVFWNLLKNAVKFTPAGGRIKVETARAPDSESIAIRITDSGIGMTPEESSRIFEAFSQGDHAASGSIQQFGGLGLGLAISRMLVEQHTGFISASSPGRNKGATFTVDLPLCRAGEPEEPRVASTHPFSKAPSAPDARVAGRKPRVLFVEDHKPTCRALTHLLTRRQYDVVNASSISEARELAGRENFDILISDIGLPDGSGYELMNDLRRQSGLVGIALTGYGMDEDVNRSQAAGFAAHLTKPVSMQGLDQALASAARARAAHAPPAEVAPSS
jgi:PAS domain S-box-containing protein